MKSVATHLRLPMAVSALLVLPLLVLELVNRRGFSEPFPLPLFGLLWLLPAVFIVILRPLLRTVGREQSLVANPVGLVLSVVSLLLVSGLWLGIILDQMPCFLGEQLCD